MIDCFEALKCRLPLIAACLGVAAAVLRPFGSTATVDRPAHASGRPRHARRRPRWRVWAGCLAAVLEALSDLLTLPNGL